MSKQKLEITTLKEEKKEPVQSNIRDTRRSKTGRKVKTCIDQLQGY